MTNSLNMYSFNNIKCYKSKYGFFVTCPKCIATYSIKNSTCSD